MDNRNVLDKYKDNRYFKWTAELIKKDIQSKSFPFAVLMEHFIGDFTIGSVLRSCNFLGGEKMFYYGSRSWDRRSAVGVQNYTDMINIKTEEELIGLKKDYVFVALENNIDGTEPLNDFVWPTEKKCLIILGEEGVGITKQTLSHCDKFVTITGYGSVRSLNAGLAGGIAMQDYVAKYLREHRES